MELPLAVFEHKDCPIHYALHGPEGAPLVVFTHGAGIDHRTFLPQVPVVAERYRTLVWDVRGHGRSRPSGRPFSIPLAAEDLAGLLDHVGYQQAVLVGQSMGAYISQELAYRQPGRVSAMVIVGATCIAMRYPRWETLALRWSLPVFRIPWEPLKRMMARSGALQPASRAYAYEAFSQLSHAEFYRIWVGVSQCLHEDPDYRFSRPLLITHGARDGTGTVRRHAAAWASREPLARYVVIPDASHMANQDNPGFFNALLLGFLDSVTGEASAGQGAGR